MKLHFPPPETQRRSAGTSPSAKMNRRRKAQPERSSLKLKTPTRSTLHHENTNIFNRSKTFDFL
ncbi:hypothetical protein Bca52824_040733 [Brassica carinata]|uniref:Uncharacterized protein n=1 Tax=Brassica carinata TaxID=52824 RepID=A0A8X7RRT8_BRACI|nr:hypothetical protein Bca52824_040733 [Brassica carinata]